MGTVKNKVSTESDNSFQNWQITPDKCTYDLIAELETDCEACPSCLSETNARFKLLLLACKDCGNEDVLPCNQCPLNDNCDWTIENSCTPHNVMIRGTE